MKMWRSSYCNMSMVNRPSKKGIMSSSERISYSFILMEISRETA